VSAVRVMVAGVGHMGGLHARKVAERARAGDAVRLVGVADADPERARSVASELGVPAAGDPRELFGGADAAIVAVPTVAHFELCSAALAADLDVLVEKPRGCATGSRRRASPRSTGSDRSPSAAPTWTSCAT
jgi:predicted dehydrogenase